MPRIIKPFASASKRTQLDRVKRSLFQSLNSFGLHSDGAKMIQNSYNATFRVHDHEGTPYAARIIVESNRTPEECKSEMEWTAFCAQGKSFSIAPPKRTNDGEYALSTQIAGLDRDCGVTVS